MSVINSGNILGSAGGGGGGGGGVSNPLTSDLDLGGNKIVDNTITLNVTGSNEYIYLQEAGTTMAQIGPEVASNGFYLRGASGKNITLQGGSGASTRLLDAGGNEILATTTTGKSVNANMWLGFAQQAADPSTSTDRAYIYSKDVAGTAEMFVMDEGGTATQISAHSRLAPASLYDNDGMVEMVVHEIQYFQGKVRFTNKTRLAKISVMTDAEKAALTSDERACIIEESFDDYNTRTGSNLSIKDWDTEQQRLQDEYDVKVAEGLEKEANIKKTKPTWLD